MAGYAIFDERIVDPGCLERYRELALPSIAQYGGRFIVRGGAITSLEGGWSPERLVIIEFESAARAQAWYDSPEYGAARRAREGGIDMRVVIVEGM